MTGRAVRTRDRKQWGYNGFGTLRSENHPVFLLLSALKTPIIWLSKFLGVGVGKIARVFLLKKRFKRAGKAIF